MAIGVETQVRYLNEEWRERDETPRIGTRETRRANTSKHDVVVFDARSRLGDLSLDVNGFTLVAHVTGLHDFRDDARIRERYYPEIEARAKEITGAEEVFITQHVVRTEDKSDFNKAYARFVHCDYSLEDPLATAHKLLEGRGLDPSDYEGADFAWYNSWQPIHNPASRNPLAVIDAATLAANDVVDYFYTGYGKDGKSSMPVRNPDHEFYYFSDMATDELLFIKQLDSRPGRASLCPHTSFDDPTADPDAPPRRSIEVRMMAVFR